MGCSTLEGILEKFLGVLEDRKEAKKIQGRPVWDTLLSVLPIHFFTESPMVWDSLGRLIIVGPKQITQTQRGCGVVRITFDGEKEKEEEGQWLTTFVVVWFRLFFLVSHFLKSLSLPFSAAPPQESPMPLK